MLRARWKAAFIVFGVVIPVSFLGQRGGILDPVEAQDGALASINLMDNAEPVPSQDDRRSWIALAAPRRSPWETDRGVLERAELGEASPLDDPGIRSRFPLVARAVYFNSPVFDRPGKGRNVIGRVRRGNLVAVRRMTRVGTCLDRGRRAAWYETPNGFVCGARQFEIADSEGDLSATEAKEQADLADPDSYTYARVIRPGAPRLARLVSAAELATARGDRARSELIISRMEGDYFVALDRIAHRDDNRYYRTIDGDYVHEEDIKILTPSTFFGEALGQGKRLPIAYVFGEDQSPVFCRGEDAVYPCGTAEKYVRFEVQGIETLAGKRYAQMPNGRWVEAAHVRIARKKRRPNNVPPGSKWVHIDLHSQTLVAYEGAVPVYATLVSTGKQGHETPVGVFRTQRKYVSTSMRGWDPVDGMYYVEEVPWTMFYHGAYAVHGAYWHNDFGRTRSHGCTNLAPTDARWLYEWETVEVPFGWHAVDNHESAGTYFVFARDLSGG